MNQLLKKIKYFALVLSILLMHTFIFAGDEDKKEESEEVGFEQSSMGISGKVEVIGMYMDGGMMKSLGFHSFPYNVFLNVDGNYDQHFFYLLEARILTSLRYTAGGYSPITMDINMMEEMASMSASTSDDMSGMGTSTEPEGEGTLVFKSDNNRAQRPSVERGYLGMKLIKEYLVLKLGLLRNPFGFWDDYTLFRNTTFIKNNPYITNSHVMLRRIDVGAEISGEIQDIFHYKIAILNGTIEGNGRSTGQETRGDDDHYKDLAGHLGFNLIPRVDLGFNGYLNEAIGRDSSQSGKRPFFYGVDIRIIIHKNIFIIAEYIHGENREGLAHGAKMDKVRKTDGAYAQLNINLDPLISGLRFNVLGDYEKTNFIADLSTNFNAAQPINIIKDKHFRIMTGLKYSLNRNASISVQYMYHDIRRDGTENMISFKTEFNFEGIQAE